MSDMSLKYLEKRAYLSYHDDGLLECLIGLVIVIFAMGMHFDSMSYMSSITPVLGVSVFAMIKKKWVVPRIGHVQFGPTRRQRMKKEHLFFVGFFAATAITGVIVFFGFERMSTELDIFLRRFILLPMGIIGVLGFSAVAYWKEIKRFFVHAGLVTLFVFGGPLLNLHHPVYFGILGSVIMIIGLIVFIRFIRATPKQMEEALDG